MCRLTSSSFARLLSQSIDPPYPSYGGLYRKEAIMLLRRFYVQENNKGTLLSAAPILYPSIAPKLKVYIRNSGHAPHLFFNSVLIHSLTHNLRNSSGPKTEKRSDLEHQNR